MNRQHDRNGFTLIELCAIMACIATILSLTSIMICLIFDLSAKHEEQITNRNSQERLLTAFRQDIKSFGEPEIVSSNEETPGVREICRWPLNNGSLVYQIVPWEKSLIQINRIQSVEGKIPNRETFLMSDNIRVDLYTKIDENSSAVIALSLWRSPLPMIRATKEDLNPFTGELSESLAKQVDPRFSSNWQTAIVRIPTP